MEAQMMEFGGLNMMSPFNNNNNNINGEYSFPLSSPDGGADDYEMEEYNNKLLYDIHGKMCVFEEKFKELDQRFNNVESELKEIKKCVTCKN